MKITHLTTAIVLVGPLFWTALPLTPAAAKAPTGQFSGNASWYGVGFNGKKTASGDVFDMNKPTGAHLSLPLPTRVMVENPRTGQAAVIKVNDRGPYAKNRVMDLSREGARRTGIFAMGVGYVECMVLPAKVNTHSAKQSCPDSSGPK